MRDKQLLNLSDALKKISSIPAKRLGQKNLGTLQEGFHADICVFDAANIASNVTTKNPQKYANGILYVLVNGQLSMQNGKRTEINAGRVLRDFKAA